MRLDQRYGVDVENALLVQICQRPTEFDRYFVLADWYEDEGDSLASECWRWLGEKKRCPETTSVPKIPTKWYWTTLTLGSKRFHSIRIPQCLLGKLTGVSAVSYPSVREAFLAVVEGWKQLTDKERKECLAWKP